MKCWNSLIAESPQRTEQSEARRFENDSDWPISSQATGKPAEGSTTRTSNLRPDKEALAKMYESMTTRQIAAVLGTANTNVSRWLREYGIPTRRPGQRPHHDLLNDADWLREQYVLKGRHSKDIAAEVGTSLNVVLANLHRHGIPVRSTRKGLKMAPEALAKMRATKLANPPVGNKNPNWRGGQIHPDKRLRTNYLSKRWSQQVRARDGHKCVECGATGKLHAHHVKPWRDHPELRWDVGNGVTLCPWCHQKAHGFPFPSWVMENAPRAQGSPKG